MLDKIKALLEEVEQFKSESMDELEQFRISYLGKKGKITALFADFKNVANEEKRAVGQKINELKNTASDKIEFLKQELSSSREVCRIRFEFAIGAPKNRKSSSYFFS